jgi:hypothetical protein
MRFEVIDSVEGRIITRYAVNVRVEMQDEDRTMKVFISPTEPEPIETSAWWTTRPAGTEVPRTDSEGYAISLLGEGV